MTIYTKGQTMTITQRFITPNEWSRPQIRIKELLGIVIHWTANPQANAEQNRAFFESRKNGLNGYGSAHYIIGQDGETFKSAKFLSSTIALNFASRIYALKTVFA